MMALPLNFHFTGGIYQVILISFTSDEGKLIFQEALAEGYMESYFSLVGNFATQTEPACKGPL